jgi:hypothetical protein
MFHILLLFRYLAVPCIARWQIVSTKLILITESRDGLAEGSVEFRCGPLPPERSIRVMSKRRIRFELRDLRLS